ncbi:ferulic acid esterase A faeA, partial [Penicillium brevicompactum]
MVSTFFKFVPALILLSQQGLAQSAVSKEVFDNISRYTSFSAAAYGDTCDSPPLGSKVIKYFSNEATDTQGVLFEDASNQELIMAFRGTSSPKDLDTDLVFTLVPLTAPGTKCSDCKVHKGFQEAYAAVEADVVATIKNHQSGSKLTVTGHSLGAGIAAIASSAFAEQFGNITTYTFGEPRNGDSAYAKYVSGLVSDDNYFRVTHYNDGVPQIPPTQLGFQHHGPEYWEKGADKNNASTTLSCGNDSDKCNAAQSFRGDPINRSHLTYTNMAIGNSLFIEACGA